MADSVKVSHFICCVLNKITLHDLKAQKKNIPKCHKKQHGTIGNKNVIRQHTTCKT